LSSVGTYWMDGGTNGFASMTSITVGNIEWKEGFSTTYFCGGWTSGGTIYGAEGVASSWQNGGIISWSTSDGPVPE